jgi:uncharacterized protein (TIGR00645 family)
MKRLELAIESIILASRWLLVVFYLGLGLALAIYALSFGKKLYEFIVMAFTLGETDTILKMLSLIDAALVASLVVMVIISGYENFVSRFDDQESYYVAGQSVVFSRVETEFVIRFDSTNPPLTEVTNWSQSSGHVLLAMRELY